MKLSLKAKFVNKEERTFIDKSNGTQTTRMYANVVQENSLERFGVAKGYELPELNSGEEYTFVLSMFTIKGARYLTICEVY